jgi:hypothetical protein
MSKPDATSAKSLEEIIASIRKSLAGDSGPGGRNAPAKTEPVLPELPPVGTASSLEAGLDALLSDRLAGALNDGGGAAPDDDLADILAHDPGKGARPDAARRLDPPGEGHSRWFAGHVLPEPPREDSNQGLPGRGPAREAPGEPPAEAIELSRPEVLRAKLPPLFGEETEPPAPPSPDANAGPAATWLPQAPGPEAPSAATMPAASPQPALASLPIDSGAATPAPAFQAIPAAVAASSAPPGPLAAAADGAGAVPGSAGKPSSSGVDGAAVAPVAAGPGTRTLEQVIAELLDPVIRHWLDSNLPRLVEKVVREEVARSLAAERPSPKADV